MGLTAIIPARGGSKRIPRKNLQPLGGKPLIAWTIEAANRAGRVHGDGVFVSTEDPDIAEVAREYGAHVIDRPPRLAEDDVPTRDVTWHACRHIGGWEYVCVLHPTSPVRSWEWIDRAWDIRDRADAVVSVTNDELNGALYLARQDVLWDARGSFFNGTVWPLHMPLPDGLDIDTPEDLARARQILDTQVVADG